MRSILSLLIPLELALAVASIASRRLIVPSVAATRRLLKLPKAVPLAAPNWSRPRTMLLVSMAVLKARNAAPTANMLAAYVAYRRTSPLNPWDWFAKSRADAPVTPALPRKLLYVCSDI